MRMQCCKLFIIIIIIAVSSQVPSPIVMKNNIFCLCIVRSIIVMKIAIHLHKCMFVYSRCYQACIVIIIIILLLQSNLYVVVSV